MPLGALAAEGGRNRSGQFRGSRESRLAAWSLVRPSVVTRRAFAFRACSLGPCRPLQSAATCRLPVRETCRSLVRAPSVGLLPSSRRQTARFGWPAAPTPPAFVRPRRFHVLDGLLRAVLAIDVDHHHVQGFSGPLRGRDLAGAEPAFTDPLPSCRSSTNRPGHPGRAGERLQGLALQRRCGGPVSSRSSGLRAPLRLLPPPGSPSPIRDRPARM